MPTTRYFSTIHRLASDVLVELDHRGVATFLPCHWLVEVVWDSEDGPVTDVVPCGARVSTIALPGQPFLDHTGCEEGHVHHAYGSDEQQAEELEEWLSERNAAASEF